VGRSASEVPACATAARYMSFPPAHSVKGSQRGAALAGTVQLAGKALPDFVIPAVRQAAANLLKRNFHIRGRTFVCLFHERSVLVGLSDKAAI
jgi:hypothetical protein